jgi:hypothetical protein
VEVACRYLEPQPVKPIVVPENSTGIEIIAPVGVGLTAMKSDRRDIFTENDDISRRLRILRQVCRIRQVELRSRI